MRAVRQLKEVSNTVAGSSSPSFWPGKPTASGALTSPTLPRRAAGSSSAQQDYRRPRTTASATSRPVTHGRMLFPVECRPATSSAS